MAFPYPSSSPPCPGKKQLYELGPGQQIKAMVRRMDPEAWKAFKNVQP